LYSLKRVIIEADRTRWQAGHEKAVTPIDLPQAGFPGITRRMTVAYAG
jgi:hypothetical protein